MKVIVKKISIVVGLVMLFSNCSIEGSEPTCTARETAPIESVTGATTVAVNTVLPLNVVYKVTNTCGLIENFEEITVEGVKFVSVAALYDGCECTQQDILRSTPYNFSASQAGTYVIRFKTSGSDIIYTIEVTN
jgi:hypothetical protein